MAEDPLKAVLHYARVLKAPRIRDSAARLADQARDGGWSHEEYLAAVLSREVAAREASGAAIRIRSAGFPTRKSLEDFNFDHQPALNRDMIAHLGTSAFLAKASNVVLLGPPGTGKTHLAIGLAIKAAQAGHRVAFATAVDWVARLKAAHHAGRLPAELAKLRRIGLLVEPPRHVRRLHLLGRMGSCQVVRRGGIRRSCVSGLCAWSPRSATSMSRSGRRWVR